MESDPVPQEKDPMSSSPQLCPGDARTGRTTLAGFFVLALVYGLGCGSSEQPKSEDPKTFTHEQTLDWIHKNKAWRRAKKTKPLWARAVEKDEMGKEFQTADRVTERAKEGYWLCVGLAGEPWFQKPERVEARYVRDGDEEKKFSFDSLPRKYQVFKPKEGMYNWVAQVQGPGITGFYIRATYDKEHPLYAPAGGYVVKDDVADPYRDNLDDVWLVQEAIFKSTYDLIP